MSKCVCTPVSVADPVEELLQRIASLRAAVAAERAELDRLDLDRLAAAAAERQALESAWERAVAAAEAKAAGDSPEAAWARHMLQGDVHRLERAAAERRRRLVEAGHVVTGADADRRPCGTPAGAVVDLARSPDAPE
jgi:enoyl reductase-like protein